MKTLQEEIREFLARTGLRQRRLAVEAAVPDVTISYLVNGVRKYVRNDTYERIMAAMSRLSANPSSIAHAQKPARKRNATMPDPIPQEAKK